MPVHLMRRKGKWRLVEHDGGLAKTPKGKARDGGGHVSKEKAMAQMRAINSSLSEK